METNNFWLDLIATLKKGQSKKQVQEDAKNLGDIKVPLIGTLNKSKTKAQIKQDLSQLNGTINLTGKVNQKGIVTSVQQATTQAQTTANKTPIQVSMNLKKDKLINDIKVFGQQNTKLFKDANMTAKYNSLLDNAKLATSVQEIQNLRLQLSVMRSEIKATNLSGLTLGDTFKKTFKRATELFTGTGGVMLLSQQLRKAWTEAINLDTSFTDLIKVQEELTRGDYPEYLERCNKKAQELASSQQALIEGATEFSRSGYSLSVSDQLTEKSTILANVGDMSASASAKAIISGVQAYEVVDGYTDVIDKAQALIDKYNKIGNIASITTEEIAKGVQEVGSVFADANTSVDEFITLLAAGNRQYQDADALALGLRTAALRIRGCTAELEEMGEETDSVCTSASKLAEKIEGLTNIDGNGGVKILEADEETFRSIYDIFLDISKVYTRMSDTDQSALLELIAGKHRASAISATLKNMSEAQELYQESIEAAGSAQEEYEKYLQSSEAALNRFKASMTETYQSVISGETVTGLLNCGNATLQFANSLGLVESTLKGFVAIGAVKVITTLSTAFKASAISASNFGTALNTLKSMSSMAKGTTEYTNALKTLKAVSVNLSETQLKQVLANKALSDSDRVAILQTTGLTKAQAQAKLAQMGLTQSTNSQTSANVKATASTFSFSAAVKGLGASLKAAFLSNPIGIAIMAISTAIGIATSAISKHNQEVEEARQKAKDAASEAKTLSDEISELASKYISLSEAVKTDANAKEDLITTQTELLKKLGLEGESIDELIDKYGSLSNAIRQASIESLKNAQIDLIAGVDATREELLNVAKDNFWGTDNIINAVGEDAVKAFKELENAGIINSGSYGSAGGSLVLIGDETVDGALENYHKLEDALKALRDSNAFTAEELSDNSLYQAIYARYSEMKNEVDAYNSSIANLNENLAQQTMLTALQGSEIPKTEDAFETFKQELIDTAIASKQFIGTEDEIANAINNYLSTIPEFAGFYGIPLEKELNKVDELIGQSKLFGQLTISQEELDKFQSSVKSAYDAYSTLMSGNYSSSELLDSIQEISKVASEMGGTLNWEFIDSKTNSLKFLGDAIERISEKYAESVLSGAGIDVDSKFGQMLANNIIQAQKASTQLEVLNDQIDSLQGAYSDLTDIIKSYNETGYITFDQLQKLLDMEPQYLACLIDENGQLQLNKEAMTELANERLNDAEAQAIQQAIAELGMLTLQDETTAVNENAQAFTNAIDDLAGYNAELANTIAEASVGAAAIRNLNAAISGAESSGATDDQIGTVLDNLNTKLQLINNVRDKVNSGGLGDALKGATKSSGSAGKKAGDAYVEAFEKELSKLKDLRDRGVIDESEYLQRLRELYTRYFADRKEYLDEFNKYEREYLEGMKSLYDSALSGISTLMDRKISAASDAKDAVIDALNEEKDAIEEAYQKQIDAIDELISKKQKQIDAINEEIKKIQDASKARKLNLDIQQQEYNLARMQSQKTQLLYKDGQFVYDVDTSGIREANEKLTELKEEKQISELEKQIDLIEKEIDLLNEQKSSIQKMMDETNKYYDNLIKEQEKYWDSVIKNMEQQKSKWEELADIQQIAEAWSYVEQVFGDLGYTVEDVLNGNEQAFEDFKSKYISLMDDMNSNASFAEGLSYATGVAKEELGSFLDKTKETADGLDVLGTKGTELDSVASSMDNLSGSASTVGKSVSDTATNLDTAATSAGTLRDNLSDVTTALSEEQTAFDNLKQTIDEVIEAINDKIAAIKDEETATNIATSAEAIYFLLLRDKILEVKESITDLGTTVTDLNTQTLDNITNSFQLLYDKIILVSGALGSGIEGSGEGVTNSISSAIQALNDISLEEGIIAQFNNLKTAIDSVTSAISGGESAGGQSQGTQSGASGSGSESGSQGGAANSLSGAITEMGETAKTVIGEPEAEGDGTVIGEFGSLETAVTGVTEAIGTGGEEGSDGGGGGQSEDDGTLIGSINDLGITSEETLGESGGDGVIGRFEEFNGVIAEAEEHVQGINQGLDEIDGKEVECTITINVKQNGSASGLGMVTGSAMNLNSATYNAKLEGDSHLEGTALVQGNWAVQSEEKNALLAEIGPEIVVRNGRYHVIGLNGAEMFNIKPGDIVFNAEQSAALLKYGKISGRGKAYADGTVGDKFASGVLRPLQPGDRAYELDKMVKDYMARTGEDIHSFLTPVNMIQRDMEQMARSINTINNIDNSNNRTQQVSFGDIHITCPGVTSAEVANQVGVELERQFSGFRVDALQFSKRR